MRSYVSYSECSSDDCTCTSAERCYCSLGADHDRLARQLKANASVRNQDTLASCRSDDKCYCSVGGEQDSTTWCDTDSCISTTKCYCKHKVCRVVPAKITAAKKATRNCIADSLALDYELFNAGGAGNRSRRNSKHLRSQEALSVKKSVEMAAVFADVKLSQTTDITNIIGPTSSEEETNVRRRNRRNSQASSRGPHNKQSSNGSQRSRPHISHPHILQAAEVSPIFRKNSQTLNDLYQTITPRVVSTTLEDSLGYLP